MGRLRNSGFAALPRTRCTTTPRYLLWTLRVLVADPKTPSKISEPANCKLTENFSLKPETPTLIPFLGGPDEGKFDRALQKAQKRFLLLFVAPNRRAFVTAQRA